ncbi:bifunctional UDP-N-acetylglucosamine diphosphorylase/glucosamine-1-phosphate N-acetyltransferase GlmU [Caminibacter mediatlanticus TB-2]|uniref:Bifunctional protein GlmU n=2 Tax=Caminibacter mediatlanticus TB-2 TaxID=391592 RepID=A0ABX5VA15_9BACT|nr:bifunctional UDP-N-acetylglucosamine diphosphorylase/glucosamine-1-phosphate N-acetyltransferase GlmU [Caminibacter mediatlanticus]QCT95041.1 bifunctional UDP-N-acetylglucosamine diphosphorylase/glucosamine-1-phosphate N-acetyltransferase GlmU [Caminibacter mediatlanticus TB-2]
MLQIIILAAGKGTRMKSKSAKVLHTLCDKPMIEYVIEESLKLTKSVDVILNHQFEKVKEVVSKYPVNIIKQDLENYPGTGGAVKEVEIKGDKIFVLNGDMPLIEANELKKFTDIDADIVMSVMKLKNPDGYGRVVIEDGKVKKIVEQKDANEDELKIPYVNAGVYLFKGDILKEYIPKLSNNNAQKEYYLTDIIEMAVNDGKIVKAIEVDEENFKGVNSKLDLAKAEEIMARRIREFWMKNGVIMHLPKTIFIDAYSSFEGECEIGSGCVIKNSIIIESEIRPNSVIEGAIIKNSGVGPMARIRPKSELIDTHIGNFVEVKASKLKGVKAGHLSYLGDSEIDEGTNIGAGTITCNYDGKAKYKTKIGKNVFIGSDTQLIAPVVIEDDVIIAAGTTVTKDVKKGNLAISRTPLKMVKDFYYKFFGSKS